MEAGFVCVFVPMHAYGLTKRLSFGMKLEISTTRMHIPIPGRELSFRVVAKKGPLTFQLARTGITDDGEHFIPASDRVAKCRERAVRAKKNSAEFFSTLNSRQQTIGRCHPI